MNVAVIFAGGTGQRMNTKTKPKQFLELHGKPILVYTLEVFQNDPNIDGIVIVMLESWIPYTQELVTRYQLTKVADIVAGGDSGQMSIFNGIDRVSQLYPEDSIVLIHDGVRPLIDEETIDKNIECASKNGSAVTVVPVTETIVVKSDDSHVGDVVERSKCQFAKAPQTYVLKELLEAHKKAQAESLYDFVDSACLMKYYGHQLHTVEGKPENIKITTPSDFYIFRAIIDARENSQIFGI